MDNAQKFLFLTGRTLLALYFVYPGIMKIVNFDGTAAYMAAHGMSLVPLFLVLTIVIQIGGGLCLALGYRIPLVSFVLAGLVLLISLVLHDFWTMEASLQRSHETQNFVKNMAIMAGLLLLAGGTTRADGRLARGDSNG